MTSVHSEAARLPRPVDHYENFPVASWLCPRRLRAPIAAIYWFARTADDIADEGDADSGSRLATLARYRADLATLFEQRRHSGSWSEVFEPLAVAVREHRLPRAELEALLDAFRQDIEYTAQRRLYRDDAELLDYCSRSANPVGRLLLHLYGVGDALSLAQSDQICTALQLINFWQDLSRDLPRGRCYPSVQALHRHGIDPVGLQAGEPEAAARALVAACARDAWQRMLQGAPLAWRLPGRIGWELRLVVQGGLRILQKIEALEHRTWQLRPRLQPPDLALMAWRAWRGSLPRPARP